MSTRIIIQPTMKKFCLAFPLIFGIVTSILAQDLVLPRKSPKASSSYTIGLTEVTVNYGAPAVKGRVIWGGLVPYNEIWRGGANEATTVEFSTDVNMEGQNLKAGKYTLFFIPGEKEWTVIVNKNSINGAPTSMMKLKTPSALQWNLK